MQRGWHVLALVHRTVSPALTALAAAGAVTLLHGDVTDEVGLRQVVKGAIAGRGGRLDAIVHCAGRASDVGRRREFRRVNYESVQHLGRLALERAVARFVFVSTTDVYGLCDFHGETEDELPLLNNVRNPYPEYKIAAEQWLRDTLPPARCAIIRPAAVWGAGRPDADPARGGLPALVAVDHPLRPLAWAESLAIGPRA